MTAPAERLGDLRLALAAAVDAGPFVRRDFGSPGDVEHKSPDQPVTRADLAVDRLLRERLTAERPDYGWLSEETRDDPSRLERERVWVVDPIDGTRSFIAGLPESMICVGLADRGEAAVGVLHNPITGELYWAVKDAGAYGARLKGAPRAPDPPADRLPAIAGVDSIVDGEWGRFALGPERLDEGGDDDVVRILVSRSEMDAGEHDRLPAEWVRIRRGSTAYKMAGVAVGLADAYLSHGPKSEWDVCAAALVVAESGARVTDRHGHDYRYNRPEPDVAGVAAARTKALHDALLEHAARRDG